MICDDEEMGNVGTVALSFQAYGENPQEQAGEFLMSSKVGHEVLWCFCHFCCWWKEGKRCDRRPQCFWQEVKFPLVWRISREMIFKCRYGIFLAYCWTLGFGIYTNMEGIKWNATHYLLANVIDKVKIATVTHIRVWNNKNNTQNTSKGFLQKEKNH